MTDKEITDSYLNDPERLTLGIKDICDRLLLRSKQLDEAMDLLTCSKFNSSENKERYFNLVRQLELK